MSRRITIVGCLVAFLFALAAAQSSWIQFFHAPALAQNKVNNITNFAGLKFPRGQILASDGSVVAYSNALGGNRYQRVYPYGNLYSGVVGFVSSQYGEWGLEAQYNHYLIAHPQPPQSLSQVLAPTSAADNLNLTLVPALQKIAQTSLAGRDGAVVALNPATGAVLAMYSNPTFNPADFTSTRTQTQIDAWVAANKPNVHGFPPLGLVATQQTLPPGSTFKVLVTAGAVVDRPDLLSKSYPVQRQTALPGTTHLLHNAGYELCGGTVSEMLPASCDQGYALLGLDLGAQVMSRVTGSFGFNQVPPLDLPGVVPSYFPPASFFDNNLAALAISSIGQQDDRATVLQNALVAAAIANGGVEMTPHLMSTITAQDGTVVARYAPTAWLRPLTRLQALEFLPMMRGVVTHGTAVGVRFRPEDDVAAKTGTAEVANTAQNNDDWMIAFAPATNPVIAIAVMLPFQISNSSGASEAGPVVKCMIEGAIALSKGLPATGTYNTCPS